MLDPGHLFEIKGKSRRPLARAMAPKLGRRGVAHAPYVDNASFIGLSADAVNARLDAVTAELSRRGFRWHELNRP